MKQLLFILTLFTFFYSASASASAYSVTQAKADMKLERYATAIENLRELVDQEQDNYEAWFLFGVAHVHEQQYHQAIEAFHQVIALRPKLAEPHNNLAAVYNNLGDTKSAVQELEKALEKRPNYTIAEENLADLYIKLALQHYRNTLQHSPNPMIEQRYARLIRVRNPMNNTIEAKPAQEQHTASPESKPVAPIAPITPTTTPTATLATTIKTKPSVAPQPPVLNTPATNVSAQESTATTPDKPMLADVSITGVLDALEIWRNAWSSQDLNTYFAAYATNYQPDGRFASVDAWKAYKTRVIQNKNFIRVAFEQVEVNFDDDKNIATVMLLQRFSSNTYNGKDFKRIAFEYTPTGWKIISEASIK